MVKDFESELEEIKEKIRILEAHNKGTKFTWAPFGFEFVLGPSWNPVSSEQSKEILRNPIKRSKKNGKTKG